MNPKLIALAVGLAALGAALAIVAQRDGPTPPPPIDPTPFNSGLLDGSGAASSEGSALAEAEGSSVPVVTNQASREIGEQDDAPPPEGTGVPAPEGPSVGVNPARDGELVRLLNPLEFREPDEDDTPPGEGTGDPANPFGEDDFAAGTVTREEQFANHMQQEYGEASERIQRCVQGMPNSTRDTVHVEMVIREPQPGTTVGIIENFQSAMLTEDRADCARRSFEAMEFPLPWLATAVEAPGFTVVADTAAEYSMEIEVEIGAE